MQCACTATVSVVRALLALVVVLQVPGHLGSGDDVRPRDTVSVVTSVEGGPAARFAVDVVGGDAFLRVRTAGVTAEIPGYDGEQYLRVAADGTVQENIASRSSGMNASRSGLLDPGPTGAAQEWVTVSRDGTVMWHDHRIHWMGASDPVTVDDNGTVQEWTVQMTVNGESVTVKGVLRLRDRASAAWWLLSVPALVGAVFLVRGNRRRWYASLCWMSSSVTFVGFLQWWSMPSGARITPVLGLFGFAALVAANTAAYVARPRPPSVPDRDWVASSVAAGCGVAFITAAFLVRDQVTSAWIPMLGPWWWARAAVPVMLAAGVVATLDGATRAVRIEPGSREGD
jgi:hypothetical protein